MRSELRRLVLATACASIALGPALVARADDVSAEFKRGVEAYRAGQTADAIHIWEAVYGQAGEKRGYRVAFNLGRAYEALGDSTHAAEFYQAFLAQMDTLHDSHATIEANVAKEESEARRELATLQAKNGRLHVPSADRSVVVKVDAAPPRVAGFTIYVSPGPHSVVFDAGAATESTRTVDVKAGEIAEVLPPPAPVPPEPPPPAPTVQPAPPPISVPPPMRRVSHPPEVERPFSPVILYIAGGATLVSIVVPVVAYSNAHSKYDSAFASQTSGNYASLTNDYNSARSTAYATLALPIALAAVTGGLTGWYFLGTRERPVADDLVPVATRVPGGAVFGAYGHF